MKTAMFDTKFAVCFTALAALGAAGCAPEDAAVDAEPTELSAEPAAQVGGTTNVPNPNGSYFASVGALGTGCPAGTTHTTITNDGKTFTMVFSSYRVELIPGSVSVTKDCQIFIRLHSPRGLSYTVTEFDYAGIASLEPGASATLSAYYYFQGNPVPSNDRSRKTLRGPFQGTFHFDDEIGTLDRVWSPCGVERDLNVRTRLQVARGNTSNANASVQVASVEGNTRLRFSLAWQSCN